jgi:phage recombination protein Bet
MSNELTTLPDKELNNVLRNSLFPGASDMSIDLVKGYCKAAGLDIMQKPCHIVSMWNSKEGRMVDTIMPGIGLYRITASRTNQYAGMTEPEYGPTVTRQIGGVECTYPEWCKITVKRNYGTHVAEFTAKEFWLENYAEKGGKERSIAPNAMWMKRPFGQISKVCEAQALRKAFPEVGSQQTSDEMEGKPMHEIEVNSIQTATPTQTLDGVLALVKAQVNDDFSWIDRKLFTKDELLIISAEIKAKRKELADNAVVADIKPETAQTSDTTDWANLIANADSMEALTAIYKSMNPEQQEQYNVDVDFRSSELVERTA